MQLYAHQVEMTGVRCVSCPMCVPSIDWLPHKNKLHFSFPTNVLIPTSPSAQLVVSVALCLLPSLALLNSRNDYSPTPQRRQRRTWHERSVATCRCTTALGKTAQFKRHCFHRRAEQQAKPRCRCCKPWLFHALTGQQTVVWVFWLP